MGTSVLVVGAGGIGGALAARLALTGGHEVSLAVRRPTPPLTFTEAGRTSSAPVRLVVDPAELGGVEWVVVATKAYDVPGVLPWLEASGSAAVAVAQNGVEHVQRVAPVVPAERVLPVIVTFGAERVEPGRVVETLPGLVRVPDGDLGRRFAALLAGGSLPVELVGDLTTALWTKLCWNLLGNTLSTLVDVPVREIALRPDLRVLALDLLAECTAAAAAEGAAVDAAIGDDILTAFAAYPDTVRSSMWQDRAAGRPFEHDAIAGAVVRAATRHGLQAPYSSMATRLLAAMSPPVTGAH